MMFMLNTSLSLQIMALVAATFLFAWGLQREGRGSGIAKLLGFITMILALLALACSLFVAGKLWQDGRMIRENMQAMHAQDMQNMQNAGKTTEAPVAEKTTPAKKK